MKKILIMINSLYGGGAEKVLQTVLNNLNTEDYEITLYSMHREKIDTNIYKSEFKYKVVFDCYQGNKKIMKHIKSLLSKIKGKIFTHCPSSLFYSLFIRENADVEIAFIEGESTKIISGSTSKRSKKYAWVHSDPIENPWTDFLYKNSIDEKKHYEKFDRIMCVSKSVKFSFLKKYGINEGKVNVQYNPVDEKEILQKSKEPIEPTELIHPLLVSVGRLEYQKGYERLLNCISRLSKEQFNFKVWIIGYGSQFDQLNQFVIDNQLEHSVELLGFQDNPYKYVIKADAFVCSSYTEGFSTVATESLILGKPVFTVDCAGMREMFGGEKCGEIVKNDEEHLYCLLRQLVSGEIDLRQYSSSATKRGKSFALKKRIQEIKEIIDE